MLALLDRPGSQTDRLIVLYHALLFVYVAQCDLVPERHSIYRLQPHGSIGCHVPTDYALASLYVNHCDPNSVLRAMNDEMDHLAPPQLPPAIRSATPCG